MVSTVQYISPAIQYWARRRKVTGGEPLRAGARSGECSGRRLEPNAKAGAEHDDGVDAGELPGRRAEGSLETRIDDLQIGRNVHPPRNRGVVVCLDRILTLQAQVELLAQKRNKAAAELGAGKADAESVIGAAWHDAFAADAGQEGVLDRVRVPVGSPEREEHTDPVLGVAVRLPEILIE